MDTNIVQHGVLSRLGFFINKQFLNTRVLLGSISAITLTSISTVFNYQFGSMLAGDDAISQTLLPIGYACLDVGALFIGGYIGLHAKKYLSKLIGGSWLAVLISLSLFTAWSYQCATDHKKISNNTTQQIQAIQDDIQRYQQQIDQSIKEKQSTRYHANKARYQLEIDQATTKLESKRTQLIELQSQNVAPEYAVFYRTPILRESPEQYMTLVRFIFSASIIFTPFIILYLMGIESTPPTTVQATKKQSLIERIKSKISSKNNVGKIGDNRSRDSVSQESISGDNIDNVDNDINDDKRFIKQYTLVKNKVMQGKLKPSYRQLESKTSVTSKYIKPILYKLESEGVTIRSGNGWKTNNNNHRRPIILFN
ncbi:MAG: hypothetical protein OXR84_13815 [Magnetovibrio sp.]|nr:hypothetical protein [Magnetovibrio sp.]